MGCNSGSLRLVLLVHLADRISRPDVLQFVQWGNGGRISIGKKGCSFMGNDDDVKW